jgi:hypothetical protein
VTGLRIKAAQQLKKIVLEGRSTAFCPEIIRQATGNAPAVVQRGHNNDLLPICGGQ